MTDNDRCKNIVVRNGRRTGDTSYMSLLLKLQRHNSFYPHLGQYKDLNNFKLTHFQCPLNAARGLSWLSIIFPSIVSIVVRLGVLDAA
jgi:hypothetical protein